jgi:predicted peptidase
MKLYGLLLLTAGVLFMGCSSDQRHAAEPGEQVAGKLTTQLSVEMDYLLYLPEGYGRQNRKWPLILFLHGAGERGSDISKVTAHGPAKLVSRGADMEFIIVSPQCPADSWWPQETAALGALLDEIIEKYDVDADRVYLTGLSMGGFGTFALARTYPERFAAIAPICGGGEPLLASRLKDVPTWVFHGERDNVVPISRSREMVEAIEKAGGDVKFTVYPEADHNSWDQTYNNPGLYKWFLSHSRK